MAVTSHRLEDTRLPSGNVPKRVRRVRTKIRLQQANRRRRFIELSKLPRHEYDYVATMMGLITRLADERSSYSIPQTIWVGTP